MSSAMDDRELGRAAALIALHPVAEREERAAEAKREIEARERREEEAQEERERREEVAARRAEERRRLGGALRDEAWRVAGWTVLSLLALGVASIALTFGKDGAEEGAALSAAWQALWMPLLIAAGFAWALGLVYDLAQAGLGRPAWSSPLLAVHPIMGIAAPLILVGVSVEAGYVPPWVWEVAPYASAAGFGASLAGRFLWQLGKGETRRAQAQFAAVLLCVAVAAGAWIVTLVYDPLPSKAAQRKLDHRLARHAPMRHCRGVPLASLPPSLLRDSLDGMVRCRQGGKRGKFYAFSSPALFDVYASQRKKTVEESGSPADECHQSPGPYVSDWWEESAPNRKLGYLICHGSGRGATIEWSDKRSYGFGSISRQGRRRLYRWWRHHERLPGS
jgi:hypothetical protein